MSRPILQLFRIGTVAMAVWITGCSTLPAPKDDGVLQREAVAGTEKPAPEPVPLNKEITAPDAAAAVRPQLSTGNGQFIRPQGLATPVKAAGGDNAVTFNFENQPVPAVVKVILGDLLKQNYTIVPGVQGNISFSTSQPVDSSQAIPILETLLSWTGNALVKQGGGYVVMPAKDAVGGNVAPSLGAASPQAGLQARLYPLHYISANEMQKLIKPFARPDSILLADPARNVIVLSGTPEDLANYERTVKTFDVDWLRGMSIGVYSLQRANVTELMPKLDSLFGPKGDTPLAGMLRFIPIERTNSLVVITTQPNYLTEVGGWIEKIDRGGGNEPQLFVYDVRNLKASDLAQYLAQIYASGNGNGGSSGAKVGPGLTSGTLGGSDNANGSANGLGSLAGSFGSSTNGGLSNGLGSSNGLNSGGLGSGTSSGLGSSGGLGGIGSNQASNGFGGFTPGGINGNGTSNSVFGSNNGQQSQQYSNEDGSIRISSVDANNQLLVRAPPSKWDEINSAIKRLDNTPLQVQIETRILEVRLTGDFQFGVQWYLEGLIKNTTDANGNIVPGQPGNQQQGALGAGGVNYSPVSATGGDAFFYSFVNHNLQVALRALETSGKTKTLSAPSMVVLNNQIAQIQVGDQVPVNSTSVNTGLTTGVVTSAQYIPTGVILGVQPRVNPGGLVYMNVMQQVSQAGTPATAGGNPPISQRALSTQVAVQSGQTVLLGGLIQQTDQTTNTGIPGLNQIPILGRLFGSTDRSKDRTELIVLITPRVITNSEEAKQITDEYQQKFESLAPLRDTADKPGSTPATTVPLK